MDPQLLHVVCVLELAHFTGSGQQSLGGHAATVDACTTNIVSLNNGNLEALQIWEIYTSRGLH